ncbi:hypothetical protein PIB30_113859, partial [Stylosanthes scabra]|nr:hypothetical protein [Stylosanthes scabra]
VETVDAILAQNKAMAQQLSALNKKLEKMDTSPLNPCGICGGPHESNQCSMIQDDQSTTEQ